VREVEGTVIKLLGHMTGVVNSTPLPNLYHGSILRNPSGDRLCWLCLIKRNSDIITCM